MSSLVVLGDMHVEIESRIDERFTGLDQNLLTRTGMDVRAGGTGVNTALAAASVFDRVTLLGAVGRDQFGAHLEEELRRSAVRLRLHRSERAGTGIAVAIRDGGPAGGVRLLMTRSVNANDELDETFIGAHRAVIAGASMFLADGYASRTPSRCAGLLRATRIAADAGAVVVFDLVPHTIDRRLSVSELDRLLADVHVLVSEAGTLGAVLGLPRPGGVIGLPHARRVLEHARARYPAMTFLLRFGVGNADQSLVAPPGAAPRHTHTGYREAADLHGFGDRLTVGELRRLFLR